MYLQHFGLAAFPFSTTPDPSFFYPSAKHKEALACLLYAVEQRKGFALVTGEVGAGKSMLCRAVLERFAPEVNAVLIVHTSLTPRQFFYAFCTELGLTAKGKSKIELIHMIRKLLLEREAARRNVVLMVDEAQDLPAGVLEEIRLLGNLETAREKLLQIVLVGQPELRRLIGTPELRQLNQRITVKFHLGMLSAEDTCGYIDHRLKVAGAAGDNGLFDAEAKMEVFRASGGTPRVINVLCDQSLLQAYVAGEKGVSLASVRRAVADMEGYYMDAPVSTQGANLWVGR